MPDQLKSFLSWLDDNILLILSCFLIVFIPLYPKIPLMDLLPGYIVRVRLEDLFILLAALVWLVQVLRGKVKWKSIISYFIIVYLCLGLLSIFTAIFITPSIPLQSLHIAKSALHWLRYAEYFMLFFITFAAVKSKRDVRILMHVFVLTTLAVIVYGYGQKFHYWPVFSTMNREFSKGVRLYLTQNARVQSTFAGHYDLAAYLVITLNLILALAFKQTNKLKKVYFHVAHILGLWLLITTASRTSFAAYLAGAVALITIIASEKDKFLAKIGWGSSRLLIIVLLMSVMTLKFGADMQDRFLHVIRGYPQIEKPYTAVFDWQEEMTEQIAVALNLSDPEKRSAKDWIAVDEDDQTKSEDDVVTATDERPTPDRPDKSRPDDVYEDIPIEREVATKSAEGKTEHITIETKRTWSENAMKYGLSMAIRLDTLWPNALEGFKHNPLLGKSYATLNKESFFHFLEADSTDNNFLRTLGETGLLGFIAFYSIIAIAIYFAYKFHQVDRTYTSALSIGFIGASVGLLVNALYIDVFAASKVAFTYWALTGTLVGLYHLKQNKKKLKKTTLMQRYLAIKSKLKQKLCS